MNFPRVKKADYGNCLVTSSRNPFYIKNALRLTGCTGLSVNGSGKLWSDLLYLTRLPQIEMLELYGFAADGLESFQGLDAQVQLKELSLDLCTKCKINWACFNDLRKAYTEYIYINNSFWSCQSLECLTIASCGESEWDNISCLHNLSYLSIIQGGMNHLASLLVKNLKCVEIHYSKNLASIGVNQHLSNLESLVITNCKKFNRLDGIEQFSKLRKIVIEDCGVLDSLRPLLALPQLEEIRFSGTKISDGKIRELLTKPSLKSILFDEQRSYDIGLEESLLALDVSKKDWPLMLREPKKWSRLTRQ
jgi:hypothetical protein